ncbi:hypothetical protein CERSUDRAFT_117726 [Gelatoporia subvermispora B]|uniref:Uncharacterized protein n=1 Tax=Ceriporiopsis subvermispora (strain B) TaxID=914234 RepID=M2R622_CERS8|nr:hypothetical protein CERSUDRAFT_117726 [Gelatoporia subvermispora B]
MDDPRISGTSLFLPQELIEHVIDFSWDDPSALARYALVCKAWLPRCRYHFQHFLRITSHTGFDEYLRRLNHAVSIPPDTLMVTEDEELPFAHVFPFLLTGQHCRSFKSFVIRRADWSTYPLSPTAFRLLSTARAITQLQLSCCRFAHARHFLRIIDGLPELQELFLERVYWRLPDIQMHREVEARDAPVIPKLKRLNAVDCPLYVLSMLVLCIHANFVSKHLLLVREKGPYSRGTLMQEPRYTLLETDIGSTSSSASDLSIPGISDITNALHESKLCLKEDSKTVSSYRLQPGSLGALDTWDDILHATGRPYWGSKLHFGSVLVYDIHHNSIFKITPRLPEISISPCGQYIAIDSRHRGGRINIWSVRERRIFQALDGCTTGISGITWSPNSTHVGHHTIGSMILRVWGVGPLQNHKTFVNLAQLFPYCHYRLSFSRIQICISGDRALVAFIEPERAMMHVGDFVTQRSNTVLVPSGSRTLSFTLDGSGLLTWGRDVVIWYIDRLLPRGTTPSNIPITALCAISTFCKTILPMMYISELDKRWLIGLEGRVMSIIDMFTGHVICRAMLPPRSPRLVKDICVEVISFWDHITLVLGLNGRMESAFTLPSRMPLSRPLQLTIQNNGNMSDGSPYAVHGTNAHVVSYSGPIGRHVTIFYAQDVQFEKQPADPVSIRPMPTHNHNSDAPAPLDAEPLSPSPTNSRVLTLKAYFVMSHRAKLERRQELIERVDRMWAAIVEQAALRTTRRCGCFCNDDCSALVELPHSGTSVHLSRSDLYGQRLGICICKSCDPSDLSKRTTIGPHLSCIHMGYDSWLCPFCDTYFHCADSLRWHVELSCTSTPWFNGLTESRYI